MKILVSLLLLPLVCLTAEAQTTPSVGSGAPTVGLQQSFVRAFSRNNFNNLVVLPPVGNVKALGSQGLVQEFTDASNSANRYALAKPNINAPSLPGDTDMVQFYPALYAYYTSVGATTAGYPTMDTTKCPTLISLPGNSCQYQLFDKPYALFAYANPVLGGSSTFAVATPIYTKWLAIGGIGTAGPATSASASATSASANTFTFQIFDQAEIFSITAGNLTGRLIAVGPGVYSTYAANGGYTGFFGLPLTDEQVLPSGNRQQSFEGGSIEYNPIGGTPIVHYPVQSISISPSGSSIRVNLADSIQLTATLFDPNGNQITDRTVVWSTSNSQILSLQPSGLSVTAKAVGGGIATVTANAGGKLSTPVTFIVTAPCCAVGEGAPTVAIQQAFQDAVTRNHLMLQLPAVGPVQRLGGGLVQTFQDAQGLPYLVTVADRSTTAFVISGALLAKFNQLGGVSGTLGYPVSDATAGGRQLFTNQAALAGNPVQLVSGPLFGKWAALNYETGAAGSPTSAASSVLSFLATIGVSQTFANGYLISAQTGTSAGRVFFSGGLIASAYSQAGGPPGSLGLPTSDEYTLSAKRRQDFEGGYVDYTPGDAAAQVHTGGRQPVITATPSAVLVGTRVRLSLGGFDAGATVKLSLTGQTDFTIQTNSGAYVWETVVPSNAASATIAIHAADTKTGAKADGSYAIKSAAEIVLQVSKASGDGQTAMPGSILTQPLDVLVRDSAGNSIAGIPVTFAASPGAQLVSAAVTTDDAGHATALVRLPSTDGLALVTATAGKQGVTFSAQALHRSLVNFPRLSQASDGPLGNGPDTIAQRGALLASSAAILRYYQNRGDLPTPNGFADVATLNQFLSGFCTSDNQGGQICDGFLTPLDSREQILNPWRLGPFVGGKLTVSIGSGSIASINDALSQDSPVLLALSLTSAGGAVASHYVVATGIAADGSIAIMDPNPAYGQSNLGAYLSGFTASGTIWQATLAGIIQLNPQALPVTGFLLNGAAKFQAFSPAGSCGNPLTVPRDDPPGGTFSMLACDGSQNAYQLDLSATAPFALTLTGLGTPASRSDLSGSGSVSFAINRVGTQWVAAPLAMNFTSAGIVNAATFMTDLAPGGLFTIFGSGLSKPGVDSTVAVNGEPAALVAQMPFQISGVIPLDISPGNATFKMTSPYGTGQQSVAVRANAPEIFLVSGSEGAVVNQDGTLNTPATPAKRGQVIVIYCTGLGAVISQGALKVSLTPVMAALTGTNLKPAFAGLTPGFVGLYQVNVLIPLTTAPGIGLDLSIQQGDFTSNMVKISIQ